MFNKTFAFLLIFQTLIKHLQSFLKAKTTHFKK